MEDIVYIILNWVDFTIINIILEENLGTPRLFYSEESANKYAEENLNWSWKVIEL